MNQKVVNNNKAKIKYQNKKKEFWTKKIYQLKKKIKIYNNKIKKN
jgi:hypothetical protein